MQPLLHSPAKGRYCLRVNVDCVDAGQFLLHQRRDGEAARLLVEAATLDAEGTLYEDAMNTAASLRRSGDLEGALTFYKMAVNMRPTVSTHENHYLNCITIYERMKFRSKLLRQK